MRARTGVAALAGAMMLMSGQAVGQQSGELFGAIAYAPKTRAIGVASDNATQAEAESVALQNCRATSSEPADCRTVMWVRNACAVLAIGKDGGWGTDWGSDRATAERKAMAVCTKYSQTCEVVRRVCALRGN